MQDLKRVYTSFNGEDHIVSLTQHRASVKVIWIAVVIVLSHKQKCQILSKSTSLISRIKILNGKDLRQGI